MNKLLNKNQEQSEEYDFKPFPKIARLDKDIIITEKIDGTLAGIFIDEGGRILTASKNRWITPDDDNAGFSSWAYDNKEELLKLGHGYHWGEWWGKGIQRGYGVEGRYWSLFNVTRWSKEPLPASVGIVPVLWKGGFDRFVINDVLEELGKNGSYAVSNFMNPEGIVIYHTGANVCFKKTFNDNHKGQGCGA